MIQLIKGCVNCLSMFISKNIPKPNLTPLWRFGEHTCSTVKHWVIIDKGSFADPLLIDWKYYEVLILKRFVVWIHPIKLSGSINHWVYHSARTRPWGLNYWRGLEHMYPRSENSHPQHKLIKSNSHRHQASRPHVLWYSQISLHTRHTPRSKMKTSTLARIRIQFCDLK